MSENKDSTALEGLLLVWYWCLIIGNALVLLSMVQQGFHIPDAFRTGIFYAFGRMISIVALSAAAVFDIQAAFQLKARNPLFFDTLVHATLINIGGTVVSGLLMIRSILGIGRYISSTIGSIVFAVIGLCLIIMYLQRSTQIRRYFDSRPLHASRYWVWIKLLPDLIISE